MREIWKPIKGYEGMYEISSYWRVRSLNRFDRRGTFHKGKLLKVRKSTIYEGLFVHLSKNGERKEKDIRYVMVHSFEGSNDLHEILSRMPD